MVRFSCTLMREKTRRPSGTCTTPRATIWSARICVSSLPSWLMEVSSGVLSSPLMVRSVVVLPAPLPPMSVTISPLSTVSEMPLRAWMLP
jgi:hypothetical protein